MNLKVSLRAERPKGLQIFLQLINVEKPFLMQKVKNLKHELRCTSIYNRISSLRLLNKEVFVNIYVNDLIVNDLSSLLTDCDLENLDRFLYFFHCIYSQSVYNKKYKSRERFVQLSSNALRDVIGTRYAKRIMDFLIDHGFIEKDGVWYHGSKCQGYRMTEKYRNGKFYLKKTNRIRLKPRIRTKTENHNYLKYNLFKLELAPGAEKMVENCGKKEESKENAAHFIESIRNKDHYFTYSPKTGRIFNHSVNAPKILRPFFRYDNKKLVEIDIQASQPLLLNTLYEGEIECNEANKFKNLTENSDFYTYVNDKVYGDNPMERDDLKDLFYEFLFGKGLYDKVRPIYTFFKAEFPILLNKIFQVKKGNYKNLPILLQKREAAAMIDTVVTYCREKFIPVFPIHDSFMLLPEHLEEVRAEMLRVFKEMYDLTPTLKVKKY